MTLSAIQPSNRRARSARQRIQRKRPEPVVALVVPALDRRQALIEVTLLFLCAGAQASDRAQVPGGPWRSILPTGTPQKQVSVTSFQLDRTPVTNADFLAFVRAHPQWQRGRVPTALADGGYLRDWHDALALGPAANPRQPVTGVSWFAARAYCESKDARLPTWYEWELAAAADGEVLDARQDAGWQQKILSWYSRPCREPLPDVGLQPPNTYGVHDLHGLVWEWVEDFNALMISADSREQGDPDLLRFCGSGALALEDRDNYALAMRLALLSSLQASSTTVNLGFRCAR
jgi:formylglycine-generating enzyme required for sulfatase activity